MLGDLGAKLLEIGNAVCGGLSGRSIGPELTYLKGVSFAGIAGPGLDSGSGAGMTD